MTIDRRRRRLVKGGLFLSSGAIAGLSGCSGILGGGGGEDPLSVVPSAADNVVYGDVAGILEDSGIETIANTLFELAAERESYTGPTSMEEALDRFQSESNLDPTAVSTAVGFSKYGQRNPADTQYGAAWYRASWAEEDVVNAIEERGPSLSKRSYSGHTVYAAESVATTQQSWIAVLSKNEYAIGTERAVKGVIDVVEDEDGGITDALRNAYESARSGLIKAAAVVPENVPTPGPGPGPSVDVSQLNKVDSSTAVLYHEGNELGVEATLRTANGDDAKDVRNIIAGGLSTAEGFVGQRSSALVDAIDEIEVSRNGDIVTVSYSKAVAEFSSLIETVFRDLQAEGGETAASELPLAVHRPAVETVVSPLRPGRLRRSDRD